MARRYRQSKFWTYWVKVTAWPVIKPYTKPQVFLLNDKCSKRLPKPSILASNHFALADMPLYWEYFFTTNIRFLVAEVMFNKGSFMNWLLYKVGCLRVDRNHYDFSFIGDSLDCLDRGEVIGIFPSSRLPVGGVPFSFKPSVAIIAMHTNAPIVPIYTDGNYGFNKRSHVMIGEPINIDDLCPDKTLPDSKRARIITTELERIVYDLGDELNRRLGKNEPVVRPGKHDKQEK
ncbi:MAG: 1-acyl-sn-glycerol-3-phosphate acyltransferase [Clostridia bacterium]|nr:1-acyl-sn-glycerol-3-phosphate acyltransferase [Clostridia bacterium]